MRRPTNVAASHMTETTLAAPTRSRHRGQGCYRHGCLLVLTLSVLTCMTSANAETITVGIGSGELFRGLGYGESVSGSNNALRPPARKGVASITNSTAECISSSSLTTINGTRVYKIADGIGIAPVATVVSSFTLDPIDIRSMTGTIGLNSTTGTTTGTPEVSTIIPANTDWCLVPDADFYIGSAQAATITGEWVIIADGSQRSGSYPFPNMYAATFGSAGSGTKNILSSTNILRVSTVACSVNTTQNIDFGSVSRDTNLYTELGRRQYPLTVNCNQTPDAAITTNINLQFSGTLYGGNATRLAMSADNIYITGEIESDTLGNVTGSGTCDAATGVPFNGTPIHVATLEGSIENDTFLNQVTWRLCSGGSGLPTGHVTASADLLVTYN